MEDYFSAIDEAAAVDAPSELVVIENYLSHKACAELVSHCSQCPSTPTSIGNIGANGVAEKTSTHGFVADRIDLPSVPKLNKKSLAICRDIFKRLIPAHYGVAIKSFEFPHILRYGSGGLYGPHSDSHNWDPNTKTWVKVLNRDYSSILYLNSDYSGGTLAFPEHNLRIKPKTGMLVLFPSDNRFVHMAEATVSGIRYALVTWAAQRGVKGVQNAPRGNTVKLK